MIPRASVVLSLLSFTSSALSQSTSTATILLPDWCVTASAPVVTAHSSASDLTTFSYSCSIDSSAVSSASAKASNLRASAESKASALRASLRPQETDNAKLRKRDDDCYGWDAFEACIPWEVTQGPSYWAAHYTALDFATANQVCTFGDGGVASGEAICTGDGRLDEQIWGSTGLDGKHTETFVKSDVDLFFIRNTVTVTLGGGGTQTEGGVAATQTTGGSDASGSAGVSGNVAGVQDTQSTGLAIPIAIPTGGLAWMGSAGGILVAALMF